MTFLEFERRVQITPDLTLSWTYWNWMLPETTGYALWLLFIWPQLFAATPPEARAPQGEEP